MDRLTGEIYTGNKLDREITDSYVFEVMVLDSGSLNQHEGFATVNISIEDSNDNVPIFMDEELVFSIEENQMIGSEVGHVHVLDPDSGRGGQVELIMLTEGQGQ